MCMCAQKLDLQKGAKLNCFVCIVAFAVNVVNTHDNEFTMKLISGPKVYKDGQNISFL